MQNWQQFEWQSISHHRQKYNHIVWHQKDVPEDELFNSGFIHNFNMQRLCRIKKQYECKNGPGTYQYSDYGMDFLCYDKEKNTYHAGQSKCYATNKVTARHCGSFQSVCTNRIKTPGYLYTTTELEENFREDLKNSQWIIHEKLHLDDSAPGNVSQQEEVNIELYDYQVEALNALKTERSCDGHNRLAIKMFCGAGKTLIVGHHLKQTRFKSVLCIAPLIESVGNLYERLPCFIPEYKKMLVDSAPGGTTDLEEIGSFVQNEEEHKIIFSTFSSAKNILAELFELNQQHKDWCIVVDEVHNVLNINTLCAFINLFDDALLLSATIPEELYDVIDAKECYSHSIDRAISNGYCCDYRIYLPYMSNDNNPEFDFPTELSDFNKDLSAKAMFIATGMLSKGSRRLIAYMKSIDECKRFLPILDKVFREYHGVKFLGEIITSDTSVSKRNEIIRSFQQFDEGSDIDIEIKIIVSVRILDEAINIPVCDSEFMSVGDTSSDGRTMQRVMRGARILSDNPNKINNVFLWCNEWSKAIDALTLFKQQDVKFHKKIACMRIDYDTQHKPVQRQKVVEQSESLMKYFDIKCMSLEDLWNIKLEKLKAFIANNDNQFPKRGADKSLYDWVQTQKNNYHGLEQDRKNTLEAIEGWVWAKKTTLKKTWDERYDELKTFIANNAGQFPKKSSTGAEKSLYDWVGKQKNNQELEQDRKNTLEAIEGWVWAKKRTTTLNTWDERYDELKTFIANNAGQFPKVSSTGAEKSLYKWIEKQKNNYHGLEQDRKNKLEAIEGWVWAKKRTTTLKTWDERYDELKTFIANNYNQFPKKSSTGAEKSLYDWVQTQKGNEKTLNHDRKNKLEAIEGWMWAKKRLQ